VDYEAIQPEVDPQFEPTEAFPATDPALAPPVDEQLPPALPPDYSIRGWDEEELRALGRRVLNQIEAFDTSRETLIADMQEDRRNWHMQRTGQPGPWAGSADVPSEGVRTSCDNFHTRLNQQIVNASPPFAAVARDQAAIEAAPLIEEALTAVLEEAEWAASADEVHGMLPRDGRCFYRVTYEIEKSLKPTIHVKEDMEAIQAMLAAGVDAPRAIYAGLETDAQGRVIRKPVFEEQVTYQGVRFQPIPYEDGVILPATVRDWTQAYGIGECLMISGAALRAGVKSKTYRKRAVDDLLRFDGDEPSEWRQEALEDQGIELDGDGLSQVDDPDKLYSDYRCYELCYKLDVKRNGTLQWCWLTVHAETGAILRFQYLPWEHGLPHYVFFTCLLVPGELHGGSVARLIATYQDAETAVLNQIIDHADLQINLGSNLIIGRNAGIKPDKWETRLGKPIFAEGDIRDQVIPIPFQPLSPEHYNLLATLKDKRELLSRTTNIGLGKEAPGSQTLGEIQILSAANNMQFEDGAARIARTWARVFDMVRYLVAQFGDGGAVRYRKTAPPSVGVQGEGEIPGQAPPSVSFEKINAETLRAKVDLMPAGLVQLSDMQSKLQQATITYDRLMALPAVQASPQVQLVLIDYYLSALKVPIKDKLMQALVGAFQQQLMAQQMMLEQAMAAQQGMADQAAVEGQASEAAAQGELQMALADQGLMPPPGAGMPQGPGGGMSPAMAPGNGAAPVGAI
jgi:hypothetical protein